MSARLAILCDYAEEHWPSMELVAEMLARELRENHSARFDVTTLRPVMKWRFSRIGAPPIADRLVNRMFDYPRWLAKQSHAFDLFHIADHSYSQLVHVLPADRTGVFCHDLDTFRCLLDPKVEPRPRWFRAMARRILEGMQKARVVFHSTNAVREQMLRYGLIDPAKLVHAPLGIAGEFTVEASDARSVAELNRAIEDGFLLHVGSCIPRKRIDVLLDVFAQVSKRHPKLWLVQVGGEWTAEQARQIARLGIGAKTAQLRGQSRETIAELYRRSRAVLVTSEAEGFGLPVIEALACGALVVASDIPVLREVGGSGAMYCAVGEVREWIDKLDAVCSGTPRLGPSKCEVPPPPLEARLAQAARYSWKAHAAIIASAYSKIGKEGMILREERG